MEHLHPTIEMITVEDDDQTVCGMAPNIAISQQLSTRRHFDDFATYFHNDIWSLQLARSSPIEPYNQRSNKP